MCAYNGGAYVAEQLESVLMRSRPPAQIIGCGDASTDSTRKILKKHRRHHPGLIKSFRNDNNLGRTRNFEKAIGLYIGDLITLSGQDDVWRRDTLEQFARRLEDTPNLGLVFSDAERIDAEGRELDASLWSVIGFDDSAKAQVRRGRGLQVFLRKPIATGCTMLLRATLREVRLPIDAPLMHDHWISLMAAACSAVDFVDEELVSYRQHAANAVGASQLSLAQRVEESQRLGISECIQDVAGLRKLLGRIESGDQDRTSLIRQKIDFLEFRTGCGQMRALDYGRYVS